MLSNHPYITFTHFWLFPKLGLSFCMPFFSIDVCFFNLFVFNYQYKYLLKTSIDTKDISSLKMRLHVFQCFLSFNLFCYIFCYKILVMYDGWTKDSISFFIMSSFSKILNTNVYFNMH